jgi:hypothetical protein
LDYAPGHNISVSSSQGDVSRIDVFAVSDAELPAEVTWRSVQGYKEALVGSFHFPVGDEQDVPKKIYINGQTCKSTMRFLLAMNEEALGIVEYFDDAGSGLRITRNC